MPAVRAVSLPKLRDKLMTLSDGWVRRYSSRPDRVLSVLPSSTQMTSKVISSRLRTANSLRKKQSRFSDSLYSGTTMESSTGQAARARSVEDSIDISLSLKDQIEDGPTVAT